MEKEITINGESFERKDVAEYIVHGATELLIKMKKQNKQKITSKKILQDKDLILSACLIEKMDQLGMIDCEVNQSVYNSYVEVAEQLEIPILSPEIFSRTLCRYYNYKIVDKKHQGKKYRIFVHDRKMSLNMPQSFELYISCLDRKNLINRITSEVYADYERYCDRIGSVAIKKIDFSRKLVNIFELKVVDKKIKGKKCRIFVERGADDVKTSNNVSD